MKTSYLKLHPDYLEISFSGNSNFNDLSELLDQIAKKFKKKNPKRILIDLLNARGSLSNTDRFKIGENTAVNRSVNLLVISDRKDGLDWLLEN